MNRPGRLGRIAFAATIQRPTRRVLSVLSQASAPLAIDQIVDRCEGVSKRQIANIMHDLCTRKHVSTNRVGSNNQFQLTHGGRNAFELSEAAFLRAAEISNERRAIRERTKALALDLVAFPRTHLRELAAHVLTAPQPLTEPLRDALRAALKEAA